MNQPQTKSSIPMSAVETLKHCQKHGLSISIVSADSPRASPLDIQVSKESRFAQSMLLHDTKASGNQSRLSLMPETSTALNHTRLTPNTTSLTESRTSSGQDLLSSNSSMLTDNKTLSNQIKISQNISLTEKTPGPQSRISQNMCAPAVNKNPVQQIRKSQNIPVSSESKTTTNQTRMSPNISVSSENKTHSNQMRISQSISPGLLENKLTSSQSKLCQSSSAMLPDNKISNIAVNRLNQNIPFPTESKTPNAQNRLNQLLPENKSSIQIRSSQSASKLMETKVTGIQSRLSQSTENNTSAIQSRLTPENKIHSNHTRLCQSVPLNQEKTPVMQTRLPQNNTVSQEIKAPIMQIRMPQNNISASQENKTPVMPSRLIKSVSMGQENKTPVMQTRVAQNLSMMLENQTSGNQSRVNQTVSVPPENKPPNNPTQRSNQASDMPRAASISENLPPSVSSASGINTTPLPNRAVVTRKMATYSVPSSGAKRKCVDRIVPIAPEQIGKAIESNQLQSFQPNKDDALKEQHLFPLQNLSPGITITPVKALNAPKNLTPTSASITCKIVQDSPGSGKEKVIVCSTCGHCSRNLTRCDACKQSIGPTTRIFHRVKNTEVKEKVAIPFLVTKSVTVGKQIIYPSLLQGQETSQTESVHFKQSKLVIMTSPQVQTQNRSKLRVKTKRRYIEPVCLTISSDEEEPMQESFSSVPEESSPSTSLPCSHESEGSKSEHSSPRELISQELHETDDPAFPGVTDIHENTENPEMEYGEEGEEEEIEDELDEAEEEEEELEEEEEDEEEELEEEEEEEDEEGIPPEDDHDEEDEQMHVDGSIERLSGPGFPICCRSIRIGSFKVHPRQNDTYIPVFLSSEGFSFQVPTVNESSKVVTITLKSSDIVYTLVHFGRCLPIMFIFTTPNCAEILRNILHMVKEDNQYFDPSSKDEKQKRITFLIDNITDEHRGFLRHIFPGETKIKEIDQKTANEILVKSTPNQNQLIKCQPLMLYQTAIADNQVQVAVSALQQQAIVMKPPITIPVTKILTYPPPPQTGGIAITSEDMACLNEGEFLNDAIIDFYLKYVFYEKLSEYSRERTHIFSSYFYPRLTQKPIRYKPGDDAPKTMQVKRHGQVKTWTRHVDIFDKDYIIIPINQNVHWFLAIICFPGRVPDAPNVPAKSEQKTTTIKSTDNVTSTDDHEVSNRPFAVVKDQNCSTDGSSQNQDENSNATSCASLQFELEEPPDSDDPSPEAPDSSTHPNANRRRKEMPCICIFDSLTGPTRWRIASTLREYLEMEWKIKIGTRRVFDRNTMQGFVLRCPQQTNFSDCGIYVLKYVESFFENPLPYFGSPMPDLSDWFTETDMANKREALKSLILDLQKRQSGSQNSASPSTQKVSPNPNQPDKVTSSPGTVQQIDHR